MERERLFLRPEQFYADQGINLMLGDPVSRIDRADRTVTVGERTLPYHTLVLATGSKARQLPDAVGGSLAGVHVVRDLADVDAMAPDCVPGKRALIIGGGYIGLEAAAVAAKIGLSVTLVEMADRILQRVAAAATSDYFRALHKDHGVEIREGVGVQALTGTKSVTGATLTDGTHLPCDLVIVGIGIVPDVGLATMADLTIDNGIATDEFGATSDPQIFAAGDCTSFPWRGERLRLESVQNAIDQAEAVAANIVGPQRPYDPKPWFWSDQYDIKLQIAGLNTGYETVIVRNGDGRSHWYYKGEQLLAVDAMNEPRAYMVGKRLLDAGKSPSPDQIADTGLELKTLLKA